MKPLFLITIVVALVGCKKGYDPALMSRLNAGEHKLVGKYKLETEFGGEGGKEFQQLIEMMSSMEGETKVEFLPDKTFAMMVAETPVTGAWSLEAGQLSLQIKQVGGKKASEVSRIDPANFSISGFSMSGKERDEFLQKYASSMALERAESLTRLRVSTDGTLYTTSPEKTLFGSLSSFFKKEPQ